VVTSRCDGCSPGTGKTHLAIAIGIRACLAGQRVQFATATEWVARLAEAKRQNSLDQELRRLSFVPLLVRMSSFKQLGRFSSGRIS
jgi:IstB-like ATP binding protein